MVQKLHSSVILEASYSFCFNTVNIHIAGQRDSLIKVSDTNEMLQHNKQANQSRKRG